MIIHGDLPPAGNKISLRKYQENPVQDFFTMHSYWVDSGTSALALALMDARAQFPDVQQPRAIIPGYCCPDLVAACVYAGIEPVAIDISVNDPTYDCEQLRAHLDDRVVAIIAVNFLGIAERLADLRQLIEGLGLRARLIEDNAQWFPAQKSEAIFESDYVVFSFGRGKPLSLLGGGLLLASTPLSSRVSKQIEPSHSVSALLPLKMRAYNWLLTPQLYLLLNRNPLLHLGRTVYIALEEILALDHFRASLLKENFHRYSERVTNIGEHYSSAAAVGGLQQMMPLESARARRLLRYPLLCASVARRDKLLVRLQREGLGATAMYQTAIDAISGVDGRVTVPAALDNACDFAQRFISLPTHDGVTEYHREKIVALLRTA
jgi:dTDP-4-amino-4,6-dideoxygalactose transaminase